jgi:hypothetical protein
MAGPPGGGASGGAALAALTAPIDRASAAAVMARNRDCFNMVYSFFDFQCRSGCAVQVVAPSVRHSVDSHSYARVTSGGRVITRVYFRLSP